MSPVRRLVVRPAFLVADEPTARLDDDLSAHVLATLRDVHAATGTGVLIAGHGPARRQKAPSARPGRAELINRA